MKNRSGSSSETEIEIEATERPRNSVYDKYDIAFGYKGRQLRHYILFDYDSKSVFFSYENFYGTYTGSLEEGAVIETPEGTKTYKIGKSKAGKTILYRIDEDGEEWPLQYTQVSLSSAFQHAHPIQ